MNSSAPVDVIYDTLDLIDKYKIDIIHIFFFIIHSNNLSNIKFRFLKDFTYKPIFYYYNII